MRRDRGSLCKGVTALGIAFFALAPATLGCAAFAADVAVGSSSRIVIGPGLGAGTLEGSLALAYQNNPQLNAQRAATRAADENVPTALSGYRPRVIGTSSLTEQYLDATIKAPGSTGAPVYAQTKGASAVSNFGVTATQTLYNGLQTSNRTRQAEQQVFAAREVLRSAEETVLLNGATAYMNLLRDAAILELQRSNVNVLEVTLRQTRDRFAAEFHAIPASEEEQKRCPYGARGRARLVNHRDRRCTPYHRDFRSLTNQWFTFHVCSTNAE